MGEGEDSLKRAAHVVSSTRMNCPLGCATVIWPFTLAGCAMNSLAPGNGILHQATYKLRCIGNLCEASNQPPAGLDPCRCLTFWVQPGMFSDTPFNFVSDFNLDGSILLHVGGPVNQLMRYGG